MSLLAGDVLRGRYKILKVIKAGGMGAVFEAHDLNLDAICAVKEMREEMARGTDPEWAIRHFQQEAQLLAQLHHPGVPKVRDFFMDGTTCFVVMDFIAGDNLEEELENKGAFPVEQVKADALQVLDILEYLHGLNPPVIHRDLKPANLIREKETGRIMLVDFGLARPSASTMSTHTSAGTVAYCPPEQLRGKAETRSLTASYWQMQLWLGQKQLQPTGVPWACYKVSAETDPLPDHWVTELYWPVANSLPASKASR